MIWMIVSSVLGLYVFLVMCFLMIGKRADQKGELLLIDSFKERGGVHTFSPLPPPARKKLRTQVSLNPQYS